MTDWNIHGPRLLAALKGLTGNEHLSLKELVYEVREREGEGWNGPGVIAWDNAVAEASAAIEAAEPKSYRVKIIATHEVRYAKKIEITAQQWAEYNNAVKRQESDAWFARWADLFIDPLSDEVGHGEYENVTMTLVAPVKS